MFINKKGAEEKEVNLGAAAHGKKMCCTSIRKCVSMYQYTTHMQIMQLKSYFYEFRYIEYGAMLDFARA